MVRRLVRRAVARMSRESPPFRGKTRLTDACDRLLAPSPIEQVVEYDGVRFKVGTGDLVERSLLYRGEYAADVLQCLTGQAAASDVYWDVGANIGTTLLTFANKSVSARCFGFEPSPRVLASLHANLALNLQLTDRVLVLGLALNDRTGPVEFYPSSERSNSGLGGLGTSGNRVSLPVCLWGVRGDDLIATGVVPAPTLMKLDVEGFELDVLRGMERTLREAERLAIVFEHCIYRFRERCIEQHAVVDYLKPLGFELSRILGSGSRALREDDLAADCDLLARKATLD